MEINVGVKLVQELATNNRDPPSRYVLCEEKRPIVASLPPSPVPVIDLNRLLKSDDHDEAAKLFAVAQSWGLFFLVGHEMPCSFLDEILNMTKEFFNLPVEERQRYTNMKDGKHYQFEGYGRDPVLSDDQILDWTDRLFLTVHPQEKRDPSLWPQIPISFGENLQDFTVKIKQVSDDILKVMAKKLHLSEDYFGEQLGEKAQIGARFSYYPHCPRPDQVFGLRPHSDSSVVTILLLDKDVGGLQVLKDDKWVDLRTLQHSLLVMFGDHMEIMSNGIVQSPLHRVMTNTEKARISVVMFYEPEEDKELKPADALINEERPSLYKKIKAKDYLPLLFDTIARSQGRTVDLLKVPH